MDSILLRLGILMKRSLLYLRSVISDLEILTM